MTKRKMGKRSIDEAEQTQETMLDAALQIFVARGFDGANLREIAELAGTTHGLIYHHFGSKEGLWQAVVDRAVQLYITAIAEQIQQATGKDHTLLRCVKEIVRSFIETSAQHPDIIRLFMYEGAHGGPRLDYLLERFEKVGQLMEPIFLEVQQQGYLRIFDNRTIFLFLLTGGAIPFALSTLSTNLLQDDIYQPAQIEQHINLITTLLFPNNTST